MNSQPRRNRSFGGGGCVALGGSIKRASVREHYSTAIKMFLLHVKSNKKEAGKPRDRAGGVIHAPCRLETHAKKKVVTKNRGDR